MSNPSEALTMWTIYYVRHTGKYVARSWIVMQGATEPMLTGDAYQADSLEAIRGRLPPGLFCQPRYEGDDPSIVETWF